VRLHHFSDFACALRRSDYLTRIIHEASTAEADPGMSAALRSAGLLGVPVEDCSFAAGCACGALGREPVSEAAHPCPSAPSRFEPS